MDERTKAASNIPLVVDMDGTLIKTDTLHEALVQLCSRNLVKALHATALLDTPEPLESVFPHDGGSPFN